MDDALWTDVHVRTRGHLPILRDAECVHAGEVVLGRMVRDDHTVGHHHTRACGMGGEEAEGVPGVHREALFVGHGGEVTHRQPILRPILEDRAVAAVGDQLMRELSDGGSRLFMIISMMDAACLLFAGYASIGYAFMGTAVGL